MNDNLSVANELNDYFKYVAVNLNRKIPISAVDPLLFVTTMYFIGRVTLFFAIYLTEYWITMEC